MTSIIAVAAFVGGALAGGAGAWYAFRREHVRYGRLFAFMLHELNTPLTSLHMTVLNFLQGVFGPLPKEHENWMNVLKEQTTRLGYLMGDTRDLVHMKFHQDLKPHPESVAVGPLIGELLGQMETSMTRSGVEVVRQIAEGLPDAFADKDELQRVLFSVIANARKFQSGGRIFISLQELPPEPNSAQRRLELVVSYQGPKLSPTDASAMLDLFYPARRKKNSDVLPCVGLGLGFCREILIRQDSSLGIEVDGNGLSRIRVRLPVPAVSDTMSPA